MKKNVIYLADIKRIKKNNKILKMKRKLANEFPRLSKPEQETLMTLLNAFLEQAKL